MLTYNGHHHLEAPPILMGIGKNKKHKRLQRREKMTKRVDRLLFHSVDYRANRFSGHKCRHVAGPVWNAIVRRLRKVSTSQSLCTVHIMIRAIQNKNEKHENNIPKKAKGENENEKRKQKTKHRKQK